MSVKHGADMNIYVIYIIKIQCDICHEHFSAEDNVRSCLKNIPKLSLVCIFDTVRDNWANWIIRKTKYFN